MQELTKEQIEKVGNTVIYLSSRVSELMRTKLLKLLFLLEEKAIKDYGKPFFGLDFKVWQFGPVVEPIYHELTEGEIKIFKDYFKKTQFDEFEAVKEFSDDEFSDNDIALMDSMVVFARHKIAKDFVRITHAENSLWKKSAKKYGVLEDLEHERKATTDYSIDFTMLFENEPESYLIDKYQSSLENALFAKNFKELRSV